MSSPPLSPSEIRKMQEELAELNRQWEGLRRQTVGSMLAGTISATAPQSADLALSPSAASPTPSTVPGWLTPVLQGVTILVLLGAAFWVGQTVGTTNTKLDNLQKSVDKFSDWKDSSSVSLGTLNTKVDNLTSKIDDLSKSKK